MTALELTGIDGRNPLGFLAAIGLIRVLDDHAVRNGTPAPRLSFHADAMPCLVTDLELDAVCDIVVDDARAQANNPALQLAYLQGGSPARPTERGAIRDLKPVPSCARAFLEQCATAQPRVANLAAAWFSELIQDKTKGNTKPTAFHFTAGQQAFLEMVEALRSGITREDVSEALVGPWRNTSTLPSLSWDSSVARYYALRANNPSTEKRGSVPAANWLAVVSLEAFPVAPHGRELVTTGISGGWKDGVFRWPLWGPALAFATMRSLVRIDPKSWTAAARRSLGVSEVLAARILRSDQGGYGSFAPPCPVMPASDRGDDW